MNDITKYVYRFVDSFVRTSDCTASWAECGDADNKKINANFLFGGFIASYESLCVYADVGVLVSENIKLKILHQHHIHNKHS